MHITGSSRHSPPTGAVMGLGWGKEGRRRDPAGRVGKLGTSLWSNLYAQWEKSGLKHTPQRDAFLSFPAPA